VSPEGVLTAIEALARDYEDLQRAALRVGQVDLTRSAMIESFQRVYERVLEKDPQSSRACRRSQP
jgi:hypothetical protein